MQPETATNRQERRADRPTAPLFEGQLLHLLLLAALLTPFAFLAGRPAVATGELWGWSASTWLWVTASAAVLHQGYVWLCWRLELHRRTLTRAFPQNGFLLCRVGFGILGLSRWAILPLAVANRGTLELPALLQWGASGVFVLLSGYLFYSVLRYFGIDRGVGLDHFEPAAREWPLVREGIFRFSSNAMYTFGFLALWVPGLLLESAAALLAASFQHAYIWVHFHCTEKPDMEHIYGGGA
jgi:hypothetical protein